MFIFTSRSIYYLGTETAFGGMGHFLCDVFKLILAIPVVEKAFNLDLVIEVAFKCFREVKRRNPIKGNVFRIPCLRTSRQRALKGQSHAL